MANCSEKWVAGVLPFNGFTYHHINGTKNSGTIFDQNGNRHTAANLLEYADPRRIKVYVHAVVNKIIFTTQGGSRPKAQGVIFYDARGGKHTAFLKSVSRSEIILATGAIGSPQLLMLSGIGPTSQLEPLGIKVVLNQTMVGREMADNPSNGLIIPSPVLIDLDAPTTVGITKFGNYIESFSGYDFLALYGSSSGSQSPPNDFTVTFNKMGESSMSSREAMANPITNLGLILEKFVGPISKGYLELRNTNASDNPKVTFNYFQAPEDLRRCVQGMETMIDVVNSKSFSPFRYRNTTTQDLLNMMLNLKQNHRNLTVTSLEQFCRDSVNTMWHYHGGCVVGKVVDRDYKVLGVESLRVIDGSTFNFSPGTNPQATTMMLGRYMGRRILQDKDR
ncbi:hypothetical protein COLO4_38017 [Corchorus olitorius]|uniref:Glucose-methanol-choline oxidoreductase N-terminal domain-containing protein n=1 Tax=Corchorus olitorius TaxID=93759 RepID=A0A1R3FXR7_9ROSI|nr:hypothetical protein COLO4_38017 [Corchorus olitorius]